MRWCLQSSEDYVPALYAPSPVSPLSPAVRPLGYTAAHPPTEQLTITVRIQSIFYCITKLRCCSRLLRSRSRSWGAGGLRKALGHVCGAAAAPCGTLCPLLFELSLIMFGFCKLLYLTFYCFLRGSFE